MSRDDNREGEMYRDHLLGVILLRYLVKYQTIKYLVQSKTLMRTSISGSQAKRLIPASVWFEVPVYR